MKTGLLLLFIGFTLLASAQSEKAFTVKKKAAEKPAPVKSTCILVINKINFENNSSIDKTHLRGFCFLETRDLQTLKTTKPIGFTWTLITPYDTMSGTSYRQCDIVYAMARSGDKVIIENLRYNGTGSCYMKYTLTVK